MLTREAIRSALIGAGLRGARIELHASYKSLGGVEGGPAALISALTNVCATILVPAFCWESSVDGSPTDRIERNAAPGPASRATPPVPFNPATAGIDSSMGVVARMISHLPGARRSAHPLGSWAAWGSDAPALTANDDWSDPHAPLKVLARLEGSVVLLGVSLTACTAIHLAEELAGRKTFIRWGLDQDGTVRRARVGGCSEGFDNLRPYLGGLLAEHAIGPSRVLIAPLQPFLDRLVGVIKDTPAVTMCATQCDRCQAAVLGGPAD